MRIPQVALVMGLTDHYDHGIAQGIIRYVRAHTDWEIFGHGWMFSPIVDLAEWQGDGVIARVARRADADILTRLGVPVVDVAGAFDEYGFTCVENDDARTGGIAGGYYADRGVTSLAFCGVDDVTWSSERQQGFQISAGTTTPMPAFSRPLDWWEQSGETSAVEVFLRGLEQPVGLFAANDSVALRVLQAARNLNIQVPDELAVVGVDNEDLTCELASPSLSSISLRLQQIGWRAAEKLDHILGGGQQGTTTLVTPGELRERDSSRIFPTSDPMVYQALQMIHQRACSGASVGEIADAVPLSRRSLEMRFFRETGQTLHQEIIRVRISRACEALRHGDAKIEVVARESGFSSNQRFFAVFRQTIGTTPGQYRRSSRSDQEP